MWYATSILKRIQVAFHTDYVDKESYKNLKGIHVLKLHGSYLFLVITTQITVRNINKSLIR